MYLVGVFFNKIIYILYLCVNILSQMVITPLAIPSSLDGNPVSGIS